MCVGVGVGVCMGVGVGECVGVGVGVCTWGFHREIGVGVCSQNCPVDGVSMAGGILFQV